MSAPQDRPGRTRKRRYDGALVLPVLAAVLMLPPFIGLAAAPVDVAGVPLIVLWLFGLWLALIVVARFLARLLREGGDG